MHMNSVHNDFVDTLGPLLIVAEFKTSRGLPPNEQCAAIFYGKFIHLKETDFIGFWFDQTIC